MSGKARLYDTDGALVDEVPIKYRSSSVKGNTGTVEFEFARPMECHDGQAVKFEYDAGSFEANVTGSPPLKKGSVVASGTTPQVSRPKE